MITVFTHHLEKVKPTANIGKLQGMAAWRPRYAEHLQRHLCGELNRLVLEIRALRSERSRQR